MSAFQENVSLKDREKELDRRLEETKRLAYGSAKIGTETMEALRTQSEKLDATEQTLEDTDYLITQSVRSLRGMTWSGSLYNAWSDAASLFTGPTPRSSSDPVSKEPTQQTTSHASQSATASRGPPPLYTGTTQQQQPKTKFDQDMDEISHALESLRAIGINLNEQLGDQLEQIDRIESATDRLNENTLAVTLRTTKVSNRTSHDNGKCIGSYQFVSMENGMLLLGADGEYLVLTNSADSSTVFDVYLRYDTIVGLCNKRTGKYVGKTMWGGISVGGLYFGSMEEWYFDFAGGESGLLCLSKNWGAGGWLKEPIAENLREDDRGIKRHILDSTSTSVRDRKHCLQFRAIACAPPQEK